MVESLLRKTKYTRTDKYMYIFKNINITVYM